MNTYYIDENYNDNDNDIELTNIIDIKEDNKTGTKLYVASILADLSYRYLYYSDIYISNKFNTSNINSIAKCLLLCCKDVWYLSLITSASMLFVYVVCSLLNISLAKVIYNNHKSKGITYVMSMVVIMGLIITYVISNTNMFTCDNMVRMIQY